ncbi:phosphoinositide 3-kinase adapter protein 1 [Betta splendens]|uniref:Phosphoinositide 3-kinase adapter protein 1 n=1 Tax=Betta splendens TaxID=158456 RepID=A0A6P7KLD7_BETSP|nr:phosphoinositide 3-kinase adapter protein 1 [Betta splendens]
MEEEASSIESANGGAPAEPELVILHAAEAHKWATYLRVILISSQKFPKSSILLYSLSPEDQLHGYNFQHLRGCSCVVVLVSGAFVDLLCDPELHAALHRLLHPPRRVVALLCGIAEDDVLADSFEHWHSWRKLYADDEPVVYVDTILESFRDRGPVEAVHESELAAIEELHIADDSFPEPPAEDETEEAAPEELPDPVPEDEEEPVAVEDLAPPAPLTCLTVQPDRVLCGGGETLFIIFTHKLEDQSAPEVEFSSHTAATCTTKVQAVVENDYTISVVAPDMPAGVVSLTVHTDCLCADLRPVTYYTSMGEVSRYLEKAADPLNFICQAFNWTCNTTESLDVMLTDSLKSRLPSAGFQLFGIRQIEEENMTTYQRNEELPTLLHFAAKYGLKKLTTVLLQCPGALQAYSVMNKNGDYPNTLAERSGFSDLRQFMDDFVETADMLKSHLEETINPDEGAEVYEHMSNTSQDIMMKYSGCSEDIYESMLGIDPECAGDLYEVMNAVNENPEEAMLRTFFQAKPHKNAVGDNKEPLNYGEEERDVNGLNHNEEEEDPYNLCPEDVYDMVDDNSSCTPVVLNRPPAPLPRPESEVEPDRAMAYISKVFSDKSAPNKTLEMEYSAVRPVVEAPTPIYDPYAGMKTPGQRQLISLQERVKVGEITVDEAVQEFKAWQFDHERRSSSIRYQQDNLKKLRESITRRHKEREKTGKELDYEISAPLQRNFYWGSNVTLECAVYESTSRLPAAPPAATQVIQRGNWKTGSTSSTSSTESNRLSTHSTFSFSSGTEPDFEDTLEGLPPPPPRPLRSSDAPVLPPPRVPPRIPERVQDKVLQERYISCPTRPPPQRPSYRQTNSAPPVPRRR